MVDYLPRVSYVYLVGQLMKERFPGICLMTEENPGKPQETVGALNSMTSLCFKWGLFPPNDVGMATLPAPLAKPIRICQRSVLRNWDLGSEDPISENPPASDVAPSLFSHFIKLTVQSAKWIAWKSKQRAQITYSCCLCVARFLKEWGKLLTVERRNGSKYFANKYLECSHWHVIVG